MGVGAVLYMCDVVVKSSRSLSHLLMSSCVFSFFIILFCLVPCGRLSWLLVSFWAHVNIVHHIISSYNVSVGVVLFVVESPRSLEEEEEEEDVRVCESKHRPT